MLRNENVEADLNDKEGLMKLLEDMKDTLKVADGCGLAAPQVTYLMHELRENGLAVDLDATTVEEAKRSILSAIGR